MRRRIALVAVLVLAVVVSVPACGRSRPPSVVVIVVDSLRADALGPQGSRPSVSPRIDRLATEGLRFERAIAPASWNLPSLSSLVTSTYPWVHGQGAPASGGADLATLAEAFSRAGYRTAAFAEVSWPILERGFGVFQNTAGPDLFGDPRGNSAAKTLTAALAWVRKDEPQPFFLLVHTYEVHSYFLGKPAHHAFARKELPAYQGPFREWGVRDLSKPAGLQVIEALMKADADDVTYVRALYRGALAGLDAEVGRFADALSGAGLDGRTVLALTSTNGEGFRPDLARVHHGGRLHDDVLRVPLLLRWPGHLGPDVSGALVGTLDVAPTLVRLAGLPDEPLFAGRPLVAAETSVLSPIRGPRFRLAALPERPTVAEEATFRVLPSGEREAATVPQLALYLEWAALIADGDKAELYDLKADPDQEKDLAAERPEVATALQEQLRRLTAGAGRAGSGPDAAQLEQLRSLGYVQ
ncbi:MAG TPA: sulfatase-like hydrolase/transferase [Vicinamibacteria bacterium]|nr:sulfatase-like hydrolase/transferase [Vicinamibacteria bacterium]